LRRREFVIGGIATGVASRFLGQTAQDEVKLRRLSVMTYCFNSIVKDPGHPNDPARTLDILDAPQMIADRYGIHHVELQHTHFASTEPAYIKELRDRVKNAKSQMTQICLEFAPLDISSPEHYQRLETIDLTKQWIDHAVALSCPRVMVNHGTLAPEVREPAVAALKTIVEYGKTKNVFITLENRGGGPRRSAAEAGAPASEHFAPQDATSNDSPGWEVIVEVIKATGAYANPDIGNFPDEESRAAGLRVLYPLSSGNSHAHYNPEQYNEADAIKISKEVGYKGLYSIETGMNNGPDPYAAVQSVRDALLKIV
jgi:sugar phosphate isomerase/epimerase